eukprot:TRINITY_DN4609_c0_g1_i3.p2 TRINITY_DN4609_c0_g1~~TRINITY_DN4609_c0_g1_i3.p2  ORF type:complete len:200 (+),score=52.81 TRINITY_DN4609_c0_g1_i3:45-644(+)
MRTNWNTKIIGKDVVLVPYQRKHVPKYHEWMKSEQLQELTGSEPLTLEEEYCMQVSWREDADKCTFIILDKVDLNKGLDEIDCMVGDTNLFLSKDEDNGQTVAEAEIMIAEGGARGKGFGQQAISLMLLYGLQVLDITKYRAKIKFGNTPSEKLFAKLGFTLESKSEVFEETTFVWEPVEKPTSILNNNLATEDFENCQ